MGLESPKEIQGKKSVNGLKPLKLVNYIMLNITALMLLRKALKNGQSFVFVTHGVPPCPLRFMFYIRKLASKSPKVRRRFKAKKSVNGLKPLTLVQYMILSMVTALTLQSLLREALKNGPSLVFVKHGVPPRPLSFTNHDMAKILFCLV